MDAPPYCPKCGQEMRLAASLNAAAMKFLNMSKSPSDRISYKKPANVWLDLYAKIPKPGSFVVHSVLPSDPTRLCS
jgi:hypothetical protein